MFQRIKRKIARKALSLLPASTLMSVATLRGRFQVEHFNKEGDLLGSYDIPNGITNVGKDLILDVMFNDVAAIANASWYIGLVDNASFTAFAAADTSASHGGWLELSEYDEANRPGWGSGASSSQTTTNGTAVTFTMNATKAVKGVFIISENTIDGTTGSLWSTAAFSAVVNVTSGDLLKVTYSVSA